MKLEQDISMVVWIGCLGLLFLAVAIHEGWFSTKTAPIITSGTENAANPGGVSLNSEYKDGFWDGVWGGAWDAMGG